MRCWWGYVSSNSTGVWVRGWINWLIGGKLVVVAVYLVSLRRKEV